MYLIAEYNTPAEAMIAQGMLLSHGIEVRTAEQNTYSSVFPTPDAGTGTGAVGLYTDTEADAARALELLQRRGE